MLEMDYSSSIGSKARCRPLLPMRWAGVLVLFPLKKEGGRANGLFAYFEAYQRLLIEAKTTVNLESDVQCQRSTLNKPCEESTMHGSWSGAAMGPLSTLQMQSGWQKGFGLVGNQLEA